MGTSWHREPSDPWGDAKTLAVITALALAAFAVGAGGVLLLELAGVIGG